jgi:hypothetical protein
VVDGKTVELTAAELLKIREEESQKAHLPNV